MDLFPSIIHDPLDICLVNNFVFTANSIASLENTDYQISLQPCFPCRRRKKTPFRLALP